MKFSSREDIDAPISCVFRVLSEFETFVQEAMGRGVDVWPLPDAPKHGKGAAWDVGFMHNGKKRNMAVSVAEFYPPEALALDLNSKNITGVVRCDAFPLSPGRTRIAISIEVRPMTLSARLLIQSLRLAKSKLDRKFKGRIAQLASDIERRCSSPV